MTHRVRSSLVVVVFTLILGASLGCSSSHAPAAGSPTDAGTSGDAVAPISGDAGVLPVDPPVPAPSCSERENRIAVTLEHIEPAPSAGSCTPDGSGIYGLLQSVEPATEVDGVRLTIDGCPDAVVACPCAITVAGVGTDAAASAAWAFTGQLVSGHWDATSIVLHLECIERCIPTLVLGAEEGYPGAPRADPAPVMLVSGDSVCRAATSDGCYWERRTIVASLYGDPATTTALDEGESALLVPLATGSDIGVHVRNVRSHERACESGPPEAPSAAWVAWSEPVGIATPDSP